MAIWSGSVSPSSSTITGAHILHTNQPTTDNCFLRVKIGNWYLHCRPNSCNCSTDLSQMIFR